MIYHRNDEEEGFSVLVLVHAGYRVIMPSPLSKDFTCVLRLGLENYSIMREQRYCFSLSLSLSHTHTHTHSLSYISTYIHTYMLHTHMKTASTLSMLRTQVSGTCESKNLETSSSCAFDKPLSSGSKTISGIFFDLATMACVKKQ